MKYLLTTTALVALLWSCDEPLSESTLSLKTGQWLLLMDIGETQIPLRLALDSQGVFTFTNGEEVIAVTDAHITMDSLHIVMPRYNSAFIGKAENDSTIIGVWYNYDKEDYSIPFAAFHQSNPAKSQGDSETYKYEVWFSPGPDAQHAIGLFDRTEDRVTGTFLTETGDFRFLEGDWKNDQINLSCFDGAHMFLFTGETSGDSISNGQFYSGKHWQEPWIGALNPDAELTHPDSLTYLLPGFETVEFSVSNATGDTIEFTAEDYQDKVTIIQIFGSWCPNCYDENEYYADLYGRCDDPALQIIPVAFEVTDDLKASKAAVNKQFEEIGITYPAYFAGKRSKQKSSEMFSMLNKIISYPTSIFIDKQGKVRKIHTGFYGPGTGIYYEEYVATTDKFVMGLLAE